MNVTTMKLMDAATAAYVDDQAAWLPHDRRGRWGVIEPGAGRYLKGIPARIRQIADRATPRRARRFSSLSQARAFARQVDGEVFRWRRMPPGGGAWRRESPWQREIATARTMRWLPGIAMEPRPDQGAGP